MNQPSLACDACHDATVGFEQYQYPGLPAENPMDANYTEVRLRGPLLFLVGVVYGSIRVSFPLVWLVVCNLLREASWCGCMGCVEGGGGDRDTCVLSSVVCDCRSDH